MRNKKNAEVAVEEVLRYLEERADENNLKSVQCKIASLRQEIEELADSFVKAKKPPIARFNRAENE